MSHTMPIERVEFLLEGLDQSQSQGVEIGPYFNPLAPKAKNWRTTVIDYAPAEVLKDNFNSMMEISGRDDIAPMKSDIEEVDIVWAGGSLEKLLEEHKITGQMDYFLSSHNIEHSIDLIDYLRGASSALKEGGTMAMAIPDLRFSFDFFRNPTTLGDALLARQLDGHIHPPAMRLDHHLNALLSEGQGAWITSQPLKDPSFNYDPNTVYAEYQSCIGLSNPTYKDCHRWVFVPASFELLLFDLRWTGLCNLKIDSLVAAEQGVMGSEFLVRLSKTPAQAFHGAEIQARRLELQWKVQAQLATRLFHPLFRSACSAAGLSPEPTPATDSGT